MTPEFHKKFLGLIAEYGHSLTRIEGEKDLMKNLENQSEALGIRAKTFKSLAMAYHRDQVAAVREYLNEQIDAFETVAMMTHDATGESN